MKCRSFFLFDAELLGEAESREAVNYAEIDDFGDAAMLASLSERARRRKLPARCASGCLATAEGFDQERIAGKMGENAQLDLRIIGGKQQGAGSGDKSGANFAA